MAEHPILLSPEMVRAILDGRQSQFRRVIVSRGSALHALAFYEVDGNEVRIEGRDVTCPYGGPGDTLYWANEPIEFIGINSLPGACRQVGVILSLFDGIRREVAIPDVDNLLNRRKVKRPSLGRWRGRRLPIEWARDWRWLVTDVRVQRVQEISEEDAVAEGVRPEYMARDARDHVQAFHNLWDRINANHGYGWEVNPWVWAVTFRREFPEVGG